MRRVLLVLFTLLTLLAVSFGQTSAPAKIRIGDELTVFVLGEASLAPSTGTATGAGGVTMSGNYTVQSDGAIYIPRVGRLVVAGFTASVGEAKLLKKLKQIYKEPVATLSIKAQRASTVFVVGGTQGVVPLLPDTDLRQVYAQAKVDLEPDLLLVNVFRQGNKIVSLPASDLVGGHPNAWNGPLAPNDVVVIEAKPFIRVWVVGTVRTPGRIRLNAGDDVYKAIAQAGDIPAPTSGVAPLRSEIEVTVRRGPESFTVPLMGEASAKKLTLEDGDVVFVEPPEQIRVLFTGEAHSPGGVLFKKGITLGAAVSSTGGASGDGTLKSVVLFRNGLASFYDVTPAPDGQTFASSPELEQDDVVYIPKNERVYYVFGEVGKTGRYLMADTRTYRLADVVAEAGGVGPNGSNHHVYIVKPGLKGKLAATEYHLDQYLKDGNLAVNPVIAPGDLVYVDHPKGATIGTVLQALSAALFIQTISRG